MILASDDMEKIKVLLLDQREIISHGVCSLFKDDLKIEMVTKYVSIANWPELIEKYQPKIIIVDVGFHGAAIVKNIKHRFEKLLILAITDDPTCKEFLDVFQLGVKAYLLIEDLTVDSLRAAIELVMKEIVLLSRPFSDILDKCKYLAPKDIHIYDPIMMSDEEGKQSVKLSEQEKTVLALTIAGASNREISKYLHIAENTTKVHLRNIMDKLGVSGKQKLSSFFQTHQRVRNKLLVEYYNLKDKITG